MNGLMMRAKAIEGGLRTRVALEAALSTLIGVHGEIGCLDAGARVAVDEHRLQESTLAARSVAALTVSGYGSHQMFLGLLLAIGKERPSLIQSPAVQFHQGKQAGEGMHSVGGDAHLMCRCRPVGSNKED